MQPEVAAILPKCSTCSCNLGTFYKWTKAKAELAVDGQVVTTEEVRRLKKQLAQLSLENDILKKAMAIFASNQTPRSY